jgi:deoxyadenosine/deoxycytidine kinase
MRSKLGVKGVMVVVCSCQLRTLTCRRILHPFAIRMSSTTGSTERTVSPTNSPQKPLLVSIEGNIGAGKSTLINNLRERSSDWCIIDEPVGVWESVRNERHETLLEVFYKDRRRWSYTFQSCALLSRYQNIERAIKSRSGEGWSSKPGQHERIFITERCLDTDFNVFTKMLNDEGSIDMLEFDIYQRLFQHLRATSAPLAGIIHVDTDPIECMRRIEGRSRGGEGGITVEYLQSIDKYQRLWIESTSVPVLKLKGEGGSHELSSVVAFIQSLEDKERKST